MDEVLALMQKALGTCPLVANLTESLSECAVYDVYTLTYDGIKRSVMLKVRIFTETMARGLELELALDHALVVPGDLRDSRTILACMRNGGGWIGDNDRHCRICYYELTLRDTNLEG